MRPKHSPVARPSLLSARRDADRCPSFWGAFGAVRRCFDGLALWRLRAADVRGKALPGGHDRAEELPGEVARRFVEFFTEDAS